MASFVLRNADVVRAMWSQIQAAWRDADPPLEIKVGRYRDTRSNAQNARMWAMLDDISRQVVWHGTKLTDEEWKDVFTAALERQKVVPGIDGGFVVLGTRTSRMKIKEMGELMELMSAFGAEHNVRFGAQEPQ